MLAKQTVWDLKCDGFKSNPTDITLFLPFASEVATYLNILNAFAFQPLAPHSPRTTTHSGKTMKMHSKMQLVRSCICTVQLFNLTMNDFKIYCQHFLHFYLKNMRNNRWILIHYSHSFEQAFDQMFIANSRVALRTVDMELDLSVLQIIAFSCSFRSPFLWFIIDKSSTH